ncbi:hypothetical protein TNCT_292781 [Trichonephila clavata]|uniref:Uncharacterized protein n=1 Tax=Trichonephila clavata TaxID=2740835 RepID=A0A8X6KAA1_TRICU|nr:hypothetical protein TNCT_292781 [Trichonephila clavata]
MGLNEPFSESDFQYDKFHILVMNTLSAVFSDDPVSIFAHMAKLLTSHLTRRITVRIDKSKLYNSRILARIHSAGDNCSVCRRFRGMSCTASLVPNLQFVSNSIYQVFVGFR